MARIAGPLDGRRHGGQSRHSYGHSARPGISSEQLTIDFKVLIVTMGYGGVLELIGPLLCEKWRGRRKGVRRKLGRFYWASSKVQDQCWRRVEREEDEDIRMSPKTSLLLKRWKWFQRLKIFEPRRRRCPVKARHFEDSLLKGLHKTRIRINAAVFERYKTRRARQRSLNVGT